MFNNTFCFRDIIYIIKKVSITLINQIYWATIANNNIKTKLL